MIDIGQEVQLVPQQASPIPVARSALVLAPHPDDEILGCGGTLYQLARKGTSVRVVIITDGALGGLSLGQEIRKTRKEESAAAAKIIGFGPPIFWEMQDRGLRLNQTLVQRLYDEIQLQKPELIFAPSFAEAHPDHQALHLALREALKRLRRTAQEYSTQLYFYEISGLLRPNVLFDITDVESIKQDAIKCFRSQLLQQPYHLQIAGLNCFRAYSTAGKIKSAEAFLLVHSDALEISALTHSVLMDRIRCKIAIDPEEFPLVSAKLPKLKPRSLNHLEYLLNQTYPNIKFYGILTPENSPVLNPQLIDNFIDPKEAFPPATEGIFLHEQFTVIVRELKPFNFNLIERMVDHFRCVESTARGVKYRLQTKDGAIEMFRSDQYGTRALLPRKIMSQHASQFERFLKPIKSFGARLWPFLHRSL